MAVKNVLFIGHDNYGAREIFTHLHKNNPDINFHVAVTTGLYYRKSFFKSVVKLLREASFWFSLSRFIELKKYQFKGDTLVSRLKKFNVNFFYTNDVNGDTAFERIKEISPDVVLSTFTMHILKKRLINFPKYGAIACHPSMIPEYRGLEVFFWALANGEKESGVSVFYVSEKIDFGRIIYQKEFPIDEDETVESIYIKLTGLCAKAVNNVLLRIKSQEEIETKPIVGKGSYFAMPTREAYRKFKQTGRKWR